MKWHLVPILLISQISEWFLKSLRLSKQNKILSKSDVLCRIKGLRSPSCEKAGSGGSLGRNRMGTSCGKDQNIVLKIQSVCFNDFQIN